MNEPNKQIEKLEESLRDSGVVSGSWKHIHEFAIKVARVVALDLVTKNLLFPRYDDPAVLVASWYPLPPKHVLREEPIPGTMSPLFRCVDGVLEVSQPDGGWDRATAELLTTIRINHFHDLVNRPYREEPQ